ncbi:hypothetical protein HHK36_027715 [Tetracentron sinense]|uniref:BHLH domain-containing protein n=1 Tax=Tetracentron sinense TaxID=13715 RepID=A0A835D4N5_TETSI|nr:hypothetical protein HHK36_027715 [Tetracentron sinense]
MADGLQNHEGMPENLRKRLAVAVRSIQWSYAIFWSISTRQQGVLKWGDGYYNGDIKTRKTMQAGELNVSQMGLQRSEQLRELYESLSESESTQQARRPSVALSPEDLSDAEWMPGRALANGQHIWLCNAHYAESKVFSRSLLAKTVVCFPYWDGVIELGVSELVSEDLTLIQHIKTSFLDFSKPVCSEQFTSNPRNANNDEDLVCEIDHEIIDTMALEKLNTATDCEMQPESAPQAYMFSIAPNTPKEEVEFDQDGVKELQGNICEELKIGSPHDSSNGCGPNQHTEDSSMLEGINGGASQVQSWQFMDDEFSNCMHGSMNSSDCISQTFVNPQKAVSSPKGRKVNNLHLQDLQECNHTKLSSLDLGPDDMHFSKTLSAILENSNPLIVGPCFHRGNHETNFTRWKRGGSVGVQMPQTDTPQKILKKILFEVARMHGGCSLKSREENGGKDGQWNLEGDNIGMNHVLLERRRREKLNEKFLVLRSLVPIISKVDKASILNDTIAYLKELETRVEELESCRELSEFEARERRDQDIVERTSDNYGNSDTANGKKHLINKRKACDIDEMIPELNWVAPKGGLPADVTVSLMDKEVLIEMRCPWRECLLLEIMDAINNLHLDAHSVQSSTADGILALTLKSKFRRAAVGSTGVIKQALQRVVSKC